MLRIKKRDEQEALKLDEHFKRTLRHIRPHILNLVSLEEAHLCKVWLDKLNSTFLQRNLRNEYLMELFRQLKTGSLEGIFKTEPPNDSLIPLPLPYHSVRISSSLSELSDYGKNGQDCLILSEEPNQKNHLQREKCNINSYKRHIDMLTVAVKNFQIQNKQLKQELTKYQEKLTDNDVIQLRNYVKQLTTHTQNENLAWKVKMLKKNVVKLRKLNSHIEHVYEEKLDRIIRDKNLEIKALQLQVQGKMSELCLSLYKEKQTELHNLVESLEKRYKALLAAANATNESQRQEYFTKIAILEAELCYLKDNLQQSSI